LALAGLSRLDVARDAFDEALAIRRELGQEVLCLDDLAGLARVALAQGDTSRALAHIEEIVAWLAGNSPEGMEFPVLVYLSGYQVLQAAADAERAKAMLEAGYKLLQERANRIQDQMLRNRFLENVPFNRDLLAAYQKSSPR